MTPNQSQRSIVETSVMAMTLHAAVGRSLIRVTPRRDPTARHFSARQIPSRFTNEQLASRRGPDHHGPRRIFLESRHGARPVRNRRRSFGNPVQARRSSPDREALSQTAQMTFAPTVVRPQKAGPTGTVGASFNSAAVSFSCFISLFNFSYITAAEFSLLSFNSAATSIRVGRLLPIPLYQSSPSSLFPHGFLEMLGTATRWGVVRDSFTARVGPRSSRPHAQTPYLGSTHFFGAHQ